MKQQRLLGLLAAAGLSAAVLTGCISDESRGWAAPVQTDDTQVVSVDKGKLDGLDMRAEQEPAWTGTLSTPLGVNDTRLMSVALSPTDTPFQGDLLRIESEIVRVRSLNVNGSERELFLERGFAGTVASAHGAGVEIEAFRRPWRFPDDWHIRDGGARGLDGVYGTPVQGSDGIMYVGDYGSWVYAFDPSEVNLDAANDDQEPDVAISNVDGAVIGGLALDEDAGLLYVTAGDGVVAVSTERLQASLAAGGGEVEPEPGFVFESGGEIWSAPVVEDGVVYVSSLDGNLYALDGASGAVNWSFESNQGLTTTPVIAGDRVLVGGFDARLYAVNKDSGELEWDYEVGNWILATPVLEGNTAFFGDFDSILHAVNVESGSPEWTLPLERGKIRGSAAISGDVIVVGTDDGWLVGVDHQTQQRIWEIDVERDIHADLVSAGDDVLMAPTGCVILSGGEVEVYYRAVEAETGTLRRVEAVC